MERERSHVGIAGAGRMARGIATAFCYSGHPVTIVDLKTRDPSARAALFAEVRDELRRDLLAISGTRELHDLHVWCLTSHQFALSAHVVVTRDADQDRVLSDISVLLERKFKIRHMTIQLERDSRREREPGAIRPRRLRVARGRDVRGDQNAGDRGDRRHREEDAAPA